MVESDSERDVDERLVEEVANGDSRAVDSLYSRHASAVYSLAWALARDAGLAEEAVQDTFCQVWREAVRFDRSRGSVRAWMLMIVRTRTLDRLRARARRLAVVSPNAQALATAEAATPQPEAESISRERAEGVRAVVAQLPADDRILVELAFFEGLSHVAIARRLGRPLGTVKSRIRRALLVLRREVSSAGVTSSERVVHRRPWNSELAPHPGALQPNPLKP